VREIWRPPLNAAEIEKLKKYHVQTNIFLLREINFKKVIVYPFRKWKNSRVGCPFRVRGKSCRIHIH
jgi:hypothetical protein